MRIDILTLFPEMCCEVLRESVIGRARERGCVEINCRNIRDYTLDKHNRVDDSPYGGGTGMIMQVQPIYDCYESLCRDTGTRPHLIYLTPGSYTHLTLVYHNILACSCRRGFLLCTFRSLSR